MKQTLNTSLPVQTRSGKKARIISTDIGGCYIAAAIKIIPGQPAEKILTYFKDGTLIKNAECEDDLVNVPEERFLCVWINCYKYKASDVIYYNSKEEADLNAMDNRIACVSLTKTYHVGEGL